MGPTQEGLQEEEALSAAFAGLEEPWFQAAGLRERKSENHSQRELWPLQGLTLSSCSTPRQGLFQGFHVHHLIFTTALKGRCSYDPTLQMWGLPPRARPLTKSPAGEELADLSTPQHIFSTSQP